MTYQNIDIKACPFCGRKEYIHIDRYQSNGEWFSYVECTECICSGPVAKLKRDAVFAWNERFVWRILNEHADQSNQQANQQDI